jgi:hypothetical protein
MLIQKLWRVAWDQWGHRNDILHRHENLVNLAEAAVIATHVQEELAIGIQGMLSGDKYLFQEHRMATTLDWPTEKKIEWLDMVPVARAAYIAKLTQLHRVHM